MAGAQNATPLAAMDADMQTPAQTGSQNQLPDQQKWRNPQAQPTTPWKTGVAPMKQILGECWDMEVNRHPLGSSIWDFKKNQDPQWECSPCAVHNWIYFKHCRKCRADFDVNNSTLWVSSYYNGAPGVSMSMDEQEYAGEATVEHLTHAQVCERLEENPDLNRPSHYRMRRMPWRSTPYELTRTEEPLPMTEQLAEQYWATRDGKGEWAKAAAEGQPEDNPNQPPVVDIGDQNAQSPMNEGSDQDSSHKDMHLANQATIPTIGRLSSQAVLENAYNTQHALANYMRTKQAGTGQQMRDEVAHQLVAAMMSDMTELQSVVTLRSHALAADAVACKAAYRAY